MFAENLKKLRKGKGWKQDQLAKILGCATNTVSIWERGARKPELSMFYKISEVFGVPVAVLLDDTEVIFRPDPLDGSSCVEDFAEHSREKLFVLYEMIASADIKKVRFALATAVCEIAQKSQIEETDILREYLRMAEVVNGA